MPAERPEDFVLRVTRRIAEIRRTKGLTQDRVAEALGTQTRAYQRMESGQNLTLYTLARIAKVLGVNPEDLVQPVTSARRPRSPPESPPLPEAAEGPRRRAARKS